MTLPVADFIVQRLLEFDQNFDVGAGVPQVGLGIDALAIILQPVVDEISVLQSTGSILAILESANPDAFPEDIVDGLGSNAFVERQLGNIGSTVERLIFFEPTAYAAAKGVLIWRGPGGQRYTNSEGVSITKAEMSLSQEAGLFYVDIPIVALEEGDAFNVEAGTISDMEAEPIGVASMRNLFRVDQGRNRETNTEFIDRIKVAVTVRALVTGRGIIVTLTETFTTIVEIRPVGFGDPEMMRDIVYNVHIGGNVDVYVRTATLTSGQKDILNLEIDTTRRRAGMAAVACLLPDVGYALSNQSLDRTSMVPVVHAIDNNTLFAEGVDYDLDDAGGLIFRRDSPPSTIYHKDSVGGTALSDKQLQLTGAFSSARAGQVLTVSSPAQLAGTYTIKTILSANLVEIFGNFPDVGFPLAGVDFQVNDLLSVSYEYNPVSIDVIATARAGRDTYTIGDVPLMLLQSIEVLDPISGQPTGVLLSGSGGFGVGGFGMGLFGIGSVPDYRLVVANPVFRFSAREDNIIEFADALVGTSVRCTYLFASAIPAIQSFMDDRDNQTEAASLVAKHFIPVFVDTTAPITYRAPAASAATALTEDAMVAVIAKFVNGLSESAGLELSEVVDLLFNNGASEVDLNLVKKVRGTIHNEDGTIQFVVPSTTGIMEIPNDPIPDPTNAPLSPRIARFVAHDIAVKRSFG